MNMDGLKVGTRMEWTKMEVELCECGSLMRRRDGFRRTRPTDGKVVGERSLVPLVLVGMVGLILWCTPLPDPYYVSCDRPCHELDWPMICRYKITLEMYQTMTSACGDCPANDTACLARHCIPGDGRRRNILTANRMLPGPTIQVCENDIVVVDVVNRAPGQALGVHWGGQTQREFPYMDGVPQLTQCPINTHTTFQYKFRATGAGTHLWRATGSPMADTVSGPLIVKQSVNRDSQRHLYDEDRPDHVFTLALFGGNDAHPEPTSILINGRGAGPPLTSILVARKRNRLRLLHSGGSPSAGPLTVSLEEHSFLLIALDGHPVVPRDAAEVTLFPGERADVVVACDRPATTYGLDIKSGKLKARALLTYQAPDEKGKVPPNDGPAQEEHKTSPPSAVVTTSGAAAGEVVTLDTLKSADILPDQLSIDAVDVTLYLPFDFQPLAGLRNDFSGPVPPAKPGGFAPPIAMPDPDEPWPRAVPRMCNISLSLPSAPLLTQPLDAATPLGGVAICRGQATPATCPGGTVGEAEHSCECAHVIDIPLGKSVELVLADQGGDGDNSHVFHLHGHSFWVVGSGQSNRGDSEGPGPLTGSWEALAEEDKKGRLLERRLHSQPVRKDTVAVPHGGVVALRFMADNPGYWLLHDQNFYRWPSGLGVILHIGEDSDLPEIPSDFPKCGSFVGPEFFLM